MRSMKNGIRGAVVNSTRPESQSMGKTTARIARGTRAA
jgi:hypothetical protein